MDHPLLPRPLSHPRWGPAPGPLAGVDLSTSEVVVVGAGVAGLAAALGCGRRSVTLLTKCRLAAGGSSPWAQGGVAAAVGLDDSPALHAADTLAVAGGLADERAVAVLAQEGPGRIAALLALGARFDRSAEGGLALGQEAAHSRRRILHAAGDATGAELVRTLTAAARTADNLRVVEGEMALALVLGGGRVVGLLAAGGDGGRRLYLAGAVVLATGGVGHVYGHTTNPPEATGDGLALAARAGARLVDLEFVQFHPTALAVGGDPMPLLTEALRGEGARIVDGAGRRFLAAEHPAAELAPRDVVARGVWRRRAAGEEVFLDAREAVGEAFPERFPTVFAACMRAGLDPRREPIPVAPAAHYHMGGIETDLSGRTSLPGLWACGEVASTGVHGANRLASNSLLEGLVFGARVAADLQGRLAGLPGTGEAELARLTASTAAAVEVGEVDGFRKLMDENVGVVRDGTGLAAAVEGLNKGSWVGNERRAAGGALADSYGLPGVALGPEPAGVAQPGAIRAAAEAANVALVGRLIATAALARRESRGAHFRTDFPETRPEWRRRQRFVLDGDGEPVLVERPAFAGQAGAGAGR